MKTSPVSENDATSAGIDAWLSGRATRAERRRLSSALKNDPAAARALAEQARAEVDLARVKRGGDSTAMLREILHGTEKSVPFQRKIRRLGNALAALAAVVGAFGIWWQLRSTNATDSTATARRTVVNVEQVIPAAIPDQPAEAPMRELGEPDDETQRLLARYRLPDGAGFKGEKVSLRTAAAMIERAIHQANLLKNPAVTALRVRVENPEDLPEDRTVSFRAGAVSAGSLLQAVAALTDSSLSWGKGEVAITMKRLPEIDDKAPLVEKHYVVPPGFESKIIPAEKRIPLKVDVPAPDASSPEQQNFVDRLAASEFFQVPPFSDIRNEFVKQFELSFPNGSRFEDMNDNTAWGRGSLPKFPLVTKLLVSAPQRDHDRVEAALTFLTSTSQPPQVFLTTKLIELPDQIQVKDQILSEAGFQMLTREWSGSQGVDLMTAPSLIVREGQSSKVEVIREVPLPDGAEDWAGFQMPVRAVMRGEAIVLEATMMRRELLEDGFYSSEIEVFATLAGRQTAVFAFPSTVPGRRLVGAVTATLLDPSGQPIATTESPEDAAQNAAIREELNRWHRLSTKPMAPELQTPPEFSQPEPAPPSGR